MFSALHLRRARDFNSRRVILWLTIRIKASRTRKVPIRSKNKSVVPQVVSRTPKPNDWKSVETIAIKSRNRNAGELKQGSRGPPNLERGRGTVEGQPP